MPIREGDDTNHPSLPPDLSTTEDKSAVVSDPYTDNRRVKKGSKPYRYILLFGTFVILLKLYIPPVYELKTGPVVVSRYDRRSGETKATVGPGQEHWIATAQMSRHILHAVIAAEDGRFYEHHGLDLDQMVKSYEVNRRKKRYARGASTISQQVVKMSFLGREKTLWRKSREAAGTLLMEMILPKDKILEWYLNLVEFGDGVYGVKQGSWHYFRTKPELLTVEQAVHLALVLPSPNNWSRGLRRRALTPFGQKRFLAILNTMKNMGFITGSQWTDAVTRGDFGRPLAGFAELMSDPDIPDTDSGNDSGHDAGSDSGNDSGDDDSDDGAPDSDDSIPDQGQESDQ